MATDTSLERPLPQNLEAERSILGAILLDNHALNAAVERVRSEDFFLSQHRQIFERMVQLAEKQQAIDVVTLMEDLSRRGELESAGGVAYLSQLADGLPRVTNVEHYARIVKEKSVLRNLAFSAAAIQEQALAAGDEADVILDRAESTIFQLAEDRVKAGLVGVKDLVIVDTPDALLVADRARAQDVSRIVARLKAAGRKEHEQHLRSYRPWGYFETLNAGPRFQVKLLHVKPGAKLSMQRHHHRSEHWVVVHGTAKVTVGETEKLVRENESVYIVATQWHRLENPGKTPLEIIEVQIGSYLGEDDIVRSDDVYHRTPDETR